MLTFEKMVLGLGNAGQSVYKDVYKAAKSALVDRVMPVRCAAAKCLEALVKEAPFVWTAELESIATTAFKAFEGSTYEVRCAVAQFLGVLLAAAHDPKAAFGGGKSMTASQSAAASKALALEECLQIISTGFLKGGGGILRGSANVVSGVAKEVRVGSSLVKYNSYSSGKKFGNTISFIVQKKVWFFLSSKKVQKVENSLIK